MNKTNPKCDVHMYPEKPNAKFCDYKFQGA